MKDTDGGLWVMIASASYTPEIDEIARIIGTRIIKDNENLWQEIKAYSEILSEMHLLEYHDRCSLNGQQFTLPSTVGKLRDDAKTKTKQQLKVDSKLVGVSHLETDSPAREKLSQEGVMSAGIIDVSDKRKIVTSDSKNGELQTNKQEGPVETKSKNNRPEKLSSRTMSADTTKNNTQQMLKNEGNNDPAEFVEQIKDMLCSDRIHLVVDKIRSALDQEKVELNKRLKQLESFMETDCEIIVTNRSSSKSTPSKSTPRSSRSNKIEDTYGDTADYGGTYSDCDVCGVSFLDQEKVPTQRTVLSSSGKNNESQMAKGVAVLCALCVGIRSRDKSTNSQNKVIVNKLITAASSSSRDGSSSSSRLGQNPKSTQLTRSSTDKEKALVSATSISLRASSTRERSRECPSGPLDDTPRGVGTTPDPTPVCVDPPPQSSKFRNRLQAARDEHHFIPDDYLFR